jgi:hypothetical protein
MVVDGAGWRSGMLLAGQVDATIKAARKGFLARFDQEESGCNPGRRR